MREIKDYLHLYLGCEVEHDTGKWRGDLVGVTFSVCEIFCDYFKRNSGHKVPEGKEFGNFKILGERLKPILRPLSDTTNEEADFRWNNFINIKEINQQVVAEEIRWLLSKGFDLFNLIPEGLAIDKTTLNP